jgi:hypothetical protein
MNQSSIIKKAQIKVIRFKFTELSTISEFYLNDRLFGYTLEDRDRGLNDTMSLEEIEKIKVYGVTAIPTGTYNVSLYDSPKHGRVPLLHNVKGFDMIEIHVGNFPKDSLGCLLLGSSFKEDTVKNSKSTVEKLVSELSLYTDINITIFRKLNNTNGIIR